MLERPPVDSGFFRRWRRRGAQEYGDRSGETRKAQNANNNFRKFRLIIVMDPVSAR